MRGLEFANNWLFPLVLLFTVATRVNFLTFVYLCAFLYHLSNQSFVFWAQRRCHAHIVTGYWSFMAMVSGLSCAMHIVWTVAGVVTSQASGNSAAHGWAVVGFQVPHGVDGLRLVTPDFLLLFLSMYILGQWREVKRRSHVVLISPPESAPGADTHYPARYVYGVAVMLFVTAAAHNSLVGVAYFAGVLVCLYVWCFGTALNVGRATLFLGAHIITVYAFQFPFITYDATIAGFFGLYQLTYSQRDPGGVYVQYAALAIAYVLFQRAHTLRRRDHCRNAVNGTGTGAMHMSETRSLLRSTSVGSQAEAQAAVHEREEALSSAKSESRILSIKLFLFHHGLKLCWVGFMYWAIEYHSWLALPFLVVLFVGVMVPPFTFAVFLPLVLGYTVLLMIVEYVYNVDGLFEPTDTLAQIGLIEYEHDWAVLSLQMVVALVMAIFYRVSFDAEVRDAIAAEQRDARDSNPTAPARSDDDGDGREVSGASGAVAAAAAAGGGEDKGAADEGSAKKAAAMLTGQFRRFWAGATDVMHVAAATFVQHAYKLALAGLYFCGLSAVDVFHALYMFFFVVFFIFPKLAERLWIVLVLYTDVVLLLLYMWQFPSADSGDSHTARLVGLVRFGHMWSGFAWHLAILLFTVAQFHAYRSSLYQTGTGPPGAVKRLEDLPLPLAVIAFFRYMSTWFRRNGLFLCYVALLLEALLNRASIIGLVYTLFVFGCLIWHHFSRSARPAIRRVWWLIVYYGGLVFFLRYVYQFDGVSEGTDAWLPHTSVFAFADIGLEQYSRSTLFVHLLGTAVVLMLCVLQGRVFKEEQSGLQRVPDDDFDAAPLMQEKERMELEHRLEAWAGFGQRFLIIHAEKITMLTIFFVAIARVNLIAGVYLLFLVCTVAFPRVFKLMIFPLLFFSQLVILLKFFFQFPFVHKHLAGDGAEWIGFLYHDVTLAGVIGSVLVMWAALLQRAAVHWERALPDAWRGSPADPCLLFLVDDGRAGGERSGWCLFVRKGKIFVATLFERRGIGICILSFLVAAFVHLNLVSVIYMVLVGMCIIPSRAVISRLWFVIMLFLSGMLMFQYVLVLHSPPDPYDYTFVWADMDPDYQFWLGLLIDNRFVLVADFFAMFFTGLLLRVFLRELTFVTVDVDTSRYEAWEKELNAVDAEGLRVPRHIMDVVNRFYLQVLVKVALVLLFFFAAHRFNLLSLGYVVFALWFLLAGETLNREGNQMWVWLGIYNYLSMLVSIMFQAPFFSPSGEPDSFQALMGLRKMSISSAFSPHGEMLDIFIFVVVALQKKVFESDGFSVFRRVMLEEHEAAKVRAKQVAQRIRDDQIQEILLQEEERVKRRERLLTLKGIFSGEEVELERLQGDDRILAAATVAHATGELVPVGGEGSEDAAAATTTSSGGEGSGGGETRGWYAETRASVTAMLDSLEARLTYLSDDLYRSPEEVQAHEADRATRSRVVRLGVLAFMAFLNNTVYVAGFLMVLNHLINANILSLVFPVTLFGYAFVAYPRPNKTYWTGVLFYTTVLIVVKYFFQFDVFCIEHHADRDVYSMFPHCAAGPRDAQIYAPGLQVQYLLGVRKFRAPDGPGFFAGILPDLVVLLSVLLHRYHLKKAGLWDISSFFADNNKEASSGGSGSGENGVGEADAEAVGSGEGALVVAEPEGDNEWDALEAGGPPPSLASSVRGFFGELTQHKERPGRDLYVWAFGTDIFLLFYLFAMYPTATGSGSDVSKSIATSQFSGDFVIVLGLHMVLIIVDRTIYLYRDMRLKIALHYALLVLVHLVVFFLLPLRINRPVAENGALLFFYVVKCVYFWSQSIQIRDGFPSQVQGQFLMRSHTQKAYVSFLVYRALPFVFELRTLLDWTCIDTTLTFYEWLKIEDIFASLYMVQCDVEYKRTSPRKKGQKQPMSTKFVTGFIVFTLLMLVLWGPLLLFSTANPIAHHNPVSGVQVELSVVGENGETLLYSTDNVRHIRDIADDEFDYLRRKFPQEIVPDFEEEMQVVRMYPYSEQSWDISAPARGELLTALRDQKRQVSIQLRYSFHRRPPHPTLQDASLLEISQAQQAQLAAVIEKRSGSVALEELYARVLRLPGQGNIEPLQTEKLGARLEFKNNSRSSWWELHQGVADVDGVEFVTVSDKVVSEGITSDLLLNGVTWFYLTIVFAIGRFLRMFVGELKQQIVFEDLPNPALLVQLTEDVFFARQDGELDMEEELFNTVIQIYRSPETIIRLTKDKLD